MSYKLIQRIVQSRQSSYHAGCDLYIGYEKADVNWKRYKVELKNKREEKTIKLGISGSSENSILAYGCIKAVLQNLFPNEVLHKAWFEQVEILHLSLSYTSVKPKMKAAVH